MLKFLVMSGLGFAAGMYFHDKLLSMYNTVRGFNKPNPPSPEVK